MASLFVLFPAILSLVLGILILLFPKFLRLLVGWYFVALGVVGLLAYL